MDKTRKQTKIVKKVKSKVSKENIIKYLPYVIAGYVVNKYAYGYRISKVDGAVNKLLDALGNEKIFKNIMPSFHPYDLLLGVIGSLALFLIMYLRAQDRKNYKHGAEFGCGKWGSSKDMEPYMDKDDFENNILLTQTERLQMNGRPSSPKYARNKNVEIIGGSGSGKTRFYVKPQLMQMHSSYCVTDPKGLVFRGQSKGYYASSVFYLVL